MLTRIKETVLELTGLEDSETLVIKINALYDSILSYLNRKTITEEMIPIVSLVISECLEQNIDNYGNIQSFKEGDLSITFSTNSPFFGKLDSYKLIRGID